MYVEPNYKTKKALKDALARGERVEVSSPGPFACPAQGQVAIEGPHFPEPHRWYGLATLKEGRVVSVK